MPPVGWIGLAQRAQHLAVGIRRRDVGEVLGHRLAGDGQAVAVHQARIEQCLHDHRHAADLVDVVHHVLAERLDVGQVRHLGADADEVVERQLHVGLVGDRQQVQHRVGGPAERHHHGDGVLERLLGHDVAGGDAALEQFDDGLTAGLGEPVAAAVAGGRGRAAGQRHADRLGGAGHGVGGVHAAAGALAGTDGALDDVDVLAGHQPARAGADGLERVDDRDVPLGAVGQLGLAGHDRSGVEEHAGQIETGGGHQHAGQRLVAAGQQHRAVEALGHHDGLDAVGDHLTGHQREVHALVAHRDAVGHRDGAELHREAAGGVHAFLDGLGQPVQRQVARGDLVPRRRDADLRLDPVVVAHAYGAEHPAGGGLLEAVGDVAAAGLDVGVSRTSGASEGIALKYALDAARPTKIHFEYPTGVSGTVVS